MKKLTKIYLSLWVGVVASFAVLIAGGHMFWFSPHHRLAKDPANIERITGG